MYPHPAMSPMRQPRPIVTLLLAAASLPCFSGCYVSTQRYPGPMRAQVNPLPPGARDRYPAGVEEVLIVRIADPVHVRRPGEVASFPLHFYSKQARMNAGSWVFSGAGGRCEVLFGDGGSVRLLGHGSGVVGSPSRGEPLFFFHECEQAVLNISKGQQVRLLGGVLLDAETGPFVVETHASGIMRVRNRSKGQGRLACRDEVFTLSPGDVIDLPLLESGMAPLELDPSFQVQTDLDRQLSFRGNVDLRNKRGGVALRAKGEHEVRGHGLRIRLGPEDDWNVLVDDFVVGGRRAGKAEAPEAGSGQAAPLPSTDAVPDSSGGAADAEGESGE